MSDDLEQKRQELSAELEEVNRKAAEARKQARAEALKNAQSLVSQFELTAEELGLAKKVKAKKTRKLEVKFRDENGNSWCGRGKTPRWMQAALTQGRTKESFLVK